MNHLTVGYVAGREVLHFFAAYGIIHMATWAIITYHAKPAVRRFLPHTLIPQLLFCGLVTLMCAYFREPWDVGKVGDPFWKSYVDWSFWFLGLSCGGWDAYRKLLYCDGKSRVWVARFVGKSLPDDVAGSES